VELGVGVGVGVPLGQRLKTMCALSAPPGGDVFDAAVSTADTSNRRELELKRLGVEEFFIVRFSY